MDDECSILHDSDGYADDTFDRVTGLWVRPLSDGTETYSGPCIVTPLGRGADTTDGDRPRSVSRVTVKLPVGSSAPPGSVLTITGSLRNEHLVDTAWRVVGEDSGTFSVTHKVTCERLVASLAEQADL